MRLLLFTFMALFISSANSQQTTHQIELLKKYTPSDLERADSIYKTIEANYLIPINDSLYAKFHLWGGIINYYRNDFLIAKNHYNKALTTRYSSNNKLFRSRIYNNIGIVQELSLKFDEALISYNNSLEIEQEEGNTTGEKVTILNIAVLYIKTKNYAEARILLKEATTFFDSIGDYEHLGICHQNLGLLYHSKQQFDSSEIANLKALKYFKLVDNPHSVSQIFNNLVYSQIGLKKFDRGHQYLDSTKKYSDTSSLFYSTRIPFVEAKLLSAEGKNSEALSILSTLSGKVESDLVLAKMIEELKMSVYASSGNIEAFDVSFEQYKIVSDSIVLLNNNNQTIQLEAIYKTKELKLALDNKAQLLYEETQKTAFLIGAFIIMLSLLTMLLLYVFKLRRLRSYVIRNVKNKTIDGEIKKENYQDSELIRLYNQCITKLKKEELYLDSDITIESLSAELGTNVTSLSASINKIGGINFNQLVNQLRVKHSETLLANDEYSINDISEMVGFSNRISFYRSFKHIIGISPKEFRDNLK